MLLKRLEVQEFTVFESIEFEFSKGINIFIGENGTGKTHLLKILYAGCNKKNNDGASFSAYFSSDGWGILKRNCSIRNELKFHLFDYANNEIAYIDGNSVGGYYKWYTKEVIKSIFIPAKDMLSHSKGLLALEREREIPFDKTLIDIVAKAQLGETKQISDFQSRLLTTISKIIEGEVVYENDTFYVKKDNGLKVEFSLEAEGLRKFGLLWKLIRNGLLDQNTILFWDEPEANINPQLIPKIIEILLELQRNGVQIFLATHEYNLAKYFEVNRKKEDEVLYHSLFKTENGVKTKATSKYREIYNNPIEKANEELYNDILEKAAEDIENE